MRLPPVQKILGEERGDDSVCVLQLRAKSILDQLEFLCLSLGKECGLILEFCGLPWCRREHTDGKPWERVVFPQEAQLVEHRGHPAQAPCEMSNATPGAG